MALGKPDRGDALADQLALFEEPVAPEIPPFRAVEDEVEAGAGRRRRFPRRTAERLGHEHRVGLLVVRLGNPPPPQLHWQLVRGVAPEAFEAETEQVADDAETVLVEPFRVARAPMVELRQIDPRHRLAALLARRM